MPALNLFSISNGGIADSDYSGKENSVSDLRNIDIHSAPGIATVQQKFTELYRFNHTIRAVTQSDEGVLYFFVDRGDDSAIYSSTSTGTVPTHVVDTTGRVISAFVYEGFLYWVHQKSSDTTTLKVDLAQWDLSKASSTIDPDFGDVATYTHTEGEDLEGIIEAPVHELNKIAYIGNGNFVSQVAIASDGSHAFIKEALDVPKQYRVTALESQKNFGTDFLIIGTVNGLYNSGGTAAVFSWDTYSDTFQGKADVPDAHIAGFIRNNNNLFVSVGAGGALYNYFEYQLYPFSKIPYPTTQFSSAFINVYSSVNIGNVSYIAVEYINNDTEERDNTIMSLGQYSADYPLTWSRDFVVEDKGDIDIDFIDIRNVADNIFVVYKRTDNTLGSATYHAATINPQEKADRGIIRTRKYIVDSEAPTFPDRVDVILDDIVPGTDVSLYQIRDTDMKYIPLSRVGNSPNFVGNNLYETTVWQFELVITTNGNKSPSFVGLSINY